MMAKTLLSVITLLVCIVVISNRVEAFPATFILTATQIFFDSIGFASDVMGIVGFFGDKENDHEDVKKTIEELGEKIAELSENQYTRLVMQSDLEKIDGIRRKIYSALVELQNYVRYGGEARKIAFLDASDQALHDIRSIPTILTQTVPGIDNNLLKYYAEHRRYNYNALMGFRYFIFQLARNGMIIEMLDRKLSGINDTSPEEEFWRNGFGQLDDQFNTIFSEANDLFEYHLEEDILAYANNTTEEFQKILSERYGWNWIDVLVVEKGSTGSKVFQDGNDKMVFVGTPTSSNVDVRIIYGDKNDTRNIFPETQFLDEWFDILPIFIRNNAKEIGTSIKTWLCFSEHMNYTVDVIQVIHSQNMRSPDIAIDKDSPAILKSIQPRGSEIGHYQIYMVLARNGTCVDNPVDGVPAVSSASTFKTGVIWKALFHLIFIVCPLLLK